MNIIYLRHLRSAEWKDLRSQVLARDQYRCQVWIDHLAEEVHHRTYARFGHEDMADLISLCKQCHHAITNIVRAERHRARKLRVKAIVRLTPAIERIAYGVQELAVSPTRRVSPINAPRWTS
jgi:5-methylcytosine-specific restriction endonuclease McrA